MPVPVFTKLAKLIFGTRNQRMVKRYLRVVRQVSQQEPEVRRLTDAELRDRTADFRRRLSAGERLADLMPEALAVAREAMDRAVGIRNIFNPDLPAEQRFDPARLPDEARRLYEETRAIMDATVARDPTGDLLGCRAPIAAWQFVDIPVGVYEAVRELYPQSRPPFRARPFDVQIIGGMVLFEGQIAEMKTGEGKTIVGPLASYLAALESKQVHVVTVNDYLVQRDRDWVFPFFRALGLTVGAIHPMHMQSHEEKRGAYRCDVVYGTTAEFGFDYLRDNMKLRPEDQVQKRRDFAIVDEVDSILIDEARTPLIISGLAEREQPRYQLADRIARDLVAKQAKWNDANEEVQRCLREIAGLEGDIRNARDRSTIPALKQQMAEAKARLPGLEQARDRYTQFYEVELDKKRANLTHEGIAEAQRMAGVGSFYVGEHIDMPHLLEQAIRAHAVYQRDRDYVVAPDDQGEMGVIIVDQNTGRKMIGRQWSDGLHQAVEAKEGVRIKEETQTMASITIQNYFKLYTRLAGMTGTADTEATEFYEIYQLDVVTIPTNVPVVREDRNDLVYLTGKDKWEQIVEEIKHFHDIGRPVLVGTTSVEKSEMLAQMLSRKHQIKHEVLNAKQHEREAEIVAGAGQLGAVMIATNMAGRGTDIKLGRVERPALIDHWKRRGLAPKDVNPEMSDDEVLHRIWRHLALTDARFEASAVAEWSDEQVRHKLLVHWAERFRGIPAKKGASMSEEQLLLELDATGGFLTHRLAIYRTVEEMGGLHIIGTERHESRRIDNQLRGRAGRQGDRGSSRFFLSLDDDLMKMFAGKKTLSLLSHLGMKEGDAIDSPMLSRAVEKAQRKVEERNFQIRKNILEYDEPMEYQRRKFYAMRQPVVEGRQVRELVWERCEQAVRNAAETYLGPTHVPKCIAEWIHQHFNVLIDAERIRTRDPVDLRRFVLHEVTEDATNVIMATVKEFMSDESMGVEGAGDEDSDDAMPESNLDVEGLRNWARTNYGAEVPVELIRSGDRSGVRECIEESARAKFTTIDLEPLSAFLAEDFGARELANWAKRVFGTEVAADTFVGVPNPGVAADRLLEQAAKLYRQRELCYPIDFALEFTTVNMPSNPQMAIQQFCTWVRSRYGLPWTPEALPSTNPQELRRLLVEEAERWDDTRIRQRAEKCLAEGRTVDEIAAWFERECMLQLGEIERESCAADPEAFVETRLRGLLRQELTHFERWIILQMLDTAWKDHLRAMDGVSDAIGFRVFSQKDPRIEFKREAASLFEEMNTNLQEKIVDVIFKGRLVPQAARPAAPVPAAPAAQASPAAAGVAPVRPLPAGGLSRPMPGVGSATAAAAMAPRAPIAPLPSAEPGMTARQQRELEQADRAGVPGAARPAPGAGKEPARAAVTVGRNEPCPCGSGKKYKQCHGKR
ncbi:MAG: preprotein translocase subunit SecA [Phycisphaeraceae bacterium]|nr:preprotein translocase subunit SecA [Phycisphaeraceae bacterium]